MLKKFVLIAICLLVYVILFEGCLYHKADIEYPGICDTVGIQYSVEIKAILDNNCKPCHYSTSAISTFNLYDYATISGFALDGQFTYGTLLSAVMHKGGADPMPKDLPMLDSCSINQIAAWVHSRAPDN